jgi:hypothetical protein
VLSITVENAAALRELADAAAGDPAGRVCVVDLWAGDEPAGDTGDTCDAHTAPTIPAPPEVQLETTAVPLLAHPRADRRALVAAEVRVLLREIEEAIAATGFTGNLRSRVTLRRAHDEALRLLDDGRPGEAHSVASAALYPVGASAGVSSVGQVRP